MWPYVYARRGQAFAVGALHVAQHRAARDALADTPELPERLAFCTLSARAWTLTHAQSAHRCHGHILTGICQTAEAAPLVEKSWYRVPSTAFRCLASWHVANGQQKHAQHTSSKPPQHDGAMRYTPRTRCLRARVNDHARCKCR